MKRIVKSLYSLLLIFSLVFVCCSCGKKLSDNYYTPSMDFKGMNFSCCSDGDNANKVRNQMVYFDFSEFVRADLNARGNDIRKITVTEATGEVFHDTQTIANLSVEIEAESGDISSGEYHILAYFTYNATNEADVKMYLMNYCFHSNSKVDTSLFEPCYEQIKDKKIP